MARHIGRLRARDRSRLSSDFFSGRRLDEVIEKRFSAFGNACTGFFWTPSRRSNREKVQSLQANSGLYAVRIVQ